MEAVRASKNEGIHNKEREEILQGKIIERIEAFHQTRARIDFSDPDGLDQMDNFVESFNKQLQNGKKINQEGQNSHFKEDFRKMKTEITDLNTFWKQVSAKFRKRIILVKAQDTKALEKLNKDLLQVIRA